jgi:hypothetical protein
MLQTLLSPYERSKLDLAKILHDVDITALGDSSALHDPLPHLAWTILLEVYANANTSPKGGSGLPVSALKSVAPTHASDIASATALLRAKGYIVISDGDGASDPSMLWLLQRGQQTVEARIKTILDLARCDVHHHV